MDKEQWEYMRGIVADKALAVIGEYRHGRYHGREVACILVELFEIANDVVDRMMLLHGKKPDTANALERQQGAPHQKGTTVDKAERIVKAIEDDFTDRRGLRQEWEQIDAETRAEIRATWTALVRKELVKDE